MLQRTRAEQVVPFYLDFVKKYPTFSALRAANQEEVYEFFSRLGLNWRARNVVRLVRTLELDFNGLIPRKIDQLRLLPGVGEYVARAVMCYAYGDAVAPVDTNVVRVICRLFGLPYDPDSGRRRKDVRVAAIALVSSRSPKEINLALLDFAAEVCQPKPRCESCSLKHLCDFYATKKTLG
jgi:A/G-specific adenine glycosylase